ncbi:MAG: TetR/AcrR family transcriptional regulator [Hyphomonas sp.]|uniref:TetR/AcrR family transcriptional regulator n=1 Tax=Hyphomonas sp. TaxID=87 RepID=UPI00352801FB
MDTDYAPEGTPADRRRQKVRDSILAAAERVFAREGESGLSIRRLADEIDYSPSAIYKYFGSKEELLEELKDAFFKRLLIQVDRVSAALTTFDERARTCVTTYVETAIERPHHYAAAFSSVAAEDDPAERVPVSWEDFIQSRKGRAFKILVDMVEEGQANGTFDASLSPVVAAKSVWAASHGLALLLIHIPKFAGMQPCGGNLSREAFVAFHADIIMRGLSAPGRLSAPLERMEQSND